MGKASQGPLGRTRGLEAEISFIFERKHVNKSSVKMSSSNHSMETCNCCMQPVTSVCQTLEEIDFERGIWSAALNGDTKRMIKILSNGENPNITDSSSFTALVSKRDLLHYFISMPYSHVK